MKKLEKKEMKSIQGGDSVRCWRAPTGSGTYNCDNGTNCQNVTFDKWGNTTAHTYCESGWLY